MSCAGCDDCQFDMTIPANVHEIHVTVECPTQADIDLFIHLCEERKIKPIVIENLSATGAVVSTDVMTSHKYVGTEEDALQTVVRIVRMAKQNNFRVVRSKIETSPTNPVWNDQGGYWETHMAVANKDRETVYSVVRQYSGLHVSRNARKPDGPLMLTIRRYDQTPEQFYEIANSYRAMLVNQGLEIDRLLVEYCWIDNNPDHDQPWMHPDLDKWPRIGYPEVPPLNMERDR